MDDVEGNTHIYTKYQRGCVSILGQSSEEIVFNMFKNYLKTDKSTKICNTNPVTLTTIVMSKVCHLDKVIAMEDQCHMANYLT